MRQFIAIGVVAASLIGCGSIQTVRKQAPQQMQGVTQLAFDPFLFNNRQDDAGIGPQLSALVQSHMFEVGDGQSAYVITAGGGRLEPPDAIVRGAILSSNVAEADSIEEARVCVEQRTSGGVLGQLGKTSCTKYGTKRVRCRERRVEVVAVQEVIDLRQGAQGNKLFTKQFTETASSKGCDGQAPKPDAELLNDALDSMARDMAKVISPHNSLQILGFDTGF